MASEREGPGESTGRLYRVVIFLASSRFCLPTLWLVKLGCPSASPSIGAAEMPGFLVAGGLGSRTDFGLRGGSFLFSLPSLASSVVMAA